MLTRRPALRSLRLVLSLPPTCVKAPVYKAAPAAVMAAYNWTGFYVDGNVGYAWGRADTTTAVPSGIFVKKNPGVFM